MTGTADLTTRKCEPCEGGVPPLAAEAAEQLLGALSSGWRLDLAEGYIEKRFEFNGFNRTMGFVNAVAWIANTEGHHPDLKVGYGYCVVRYTTHVIDGLSENDFICAAKIDRLLT